MSESNRAFEQVNIQLCEIIFYQHQPMHLMGIKLPSPFLKASSHVLLALKYFEKIFFVIFTVKMVLILPLWHAVFEIGFNY